MRLVLVHLLLIALLLSAFSTAVEFDDEFDDDFDKEDELDQNSWLLLAEHARESNASLQWGPYRPNLYLGIRPRGYPESFLSGLMWYNVDSYKGIQNTRHSCEQGDNIAGYGWEIYDTREGGRQVIHDVEHGIDLFTEFVKDGGSWGLRVRGVPRTPDIKTAIVFYFGTEGLSHSRSLNKGSDRRTLEDAVYGGHINGIGNFKLTITRGPDSNKGPPKENLMTDARFGDRAHSRSVSVDSSTMWRAKDYYMKLVHERIEKIQSTVLSKEQLPPASELFTVDDESAPGNLHFIQRNFMGGFEFDVLFDSEGETPITCELTCSLYRANASAQRVTSLLESSIASFDNRFAEVFAPSEPFTSPEHVQFGKALFSNLLGGIGYFHGSALVDRSEGAYDDEEEEEFWHSRGLPQITETEPLSLFSAVPSRPFFPRGFLWDEGFHLIPILKWDPDLALEIIKSWLSLADDEGWIAREQILGQEARSKVPPEFQTQFPTFANPPTLVLALASFVSDVKTFSFGTDGGIPVADDMSQQFISFPDSSARNAHLHSKALAKAAVKAIYPTLKTHFYWYRRTQSADIRTWHDPSVPRPPSWTEGYRWRGRTPNHCLTSGLDDYPRALPPHPAEMHVDLLAWIGAMTRSMIEIGEFVDAPASDIERYRSILQGIRGNLDKMHWSEDAGLYCDLAWNMDSEARVKECHEGYVSLLPFLVGLAPVDKVGSIVRKLRDPDGLWSRHGIRSLSLHDPNSGTGENYWRGSIWINMNYMVLTALSNYYDDEAISDDVRSLISETYKDLRLNLVNTVFSEWQATGFAYEQYEQATGKGKGVKHFLGWTSLITVIMSMPESLD